MSRIAEQYIKLSCAECKNVNYRVKKNKKIHKEKLELKKFCPKCRKHTAHREGK